MTKTATVRAQQKWEYLGINRKTEEYLVNELNESGQAGWELVGATYHKDTKGIGESWSWTALLKRPFVEQPPTAQQETAATTPQPAQQPAKVEPPKAGSQDGPEIFDLRT